MEAITEKMNEIGEYDQSLLIIDVDSMVGVTVSES
jgi:hypothetical protein